MNSFSKDDCSAFEQALTPEIYARFREAVAIGRWPNGIALTDEQRATCLKALIIYENAHLPPEQRTGYVPPKETPCAPHTDDNETPLSWK